MDVQPAETFVLHYDLVVINVAIYCLVVNKVGANVLVQFASEGLTETNYNNPGILGHLVAVQIFLGLLFFQCPWVT